MLRSKLVTLISCLCFLGAVWFLIAVPDAIGSRTDFILLAFCSLAIVFFALLDIDDKPHGKNGNKG